MVTIVRQSISNVEAGALAAAARESESRQEDVWTHSSSIPTLEFDSGGSEAAGQEGRKQVCMCVWMKENVSVFKDREVRKWWLWVLITVGVFQSSIGESEVEPRRKLKG